MFFFSPEKKMKKTKFCQMIENVIASILSTGRPPNSDFLIGFWPVENLLFFLKLYDTGDRTPNSVDFVLRILF